VARHRIGLVGCGGIAHAHILGYRAVLGDLGDVVACCDIEQERLHAFADRIQFVVGRRAEPVACVARRWNPSVHGETYTSLTVQFEGGAIGTMVSNWHALGVPECRLRVDGTDGSLLSVKRAVVEDECTLTLHRLGEEPRLQDCSLRDALRATMGRNMEHLLVAVDANTEPCHSGRDNLATMAIVDAAHLSASRGGAAVNVAEVVRGSR
jgi:predicted dehydrogenase